MTKDSNAYASPSVGSVRITASWPSNMNKTGTDGGLSLSAASFGIGKPAAAERGFRDTRQVRLDVENGRAVEHIDTAYPQPRALPPEQLDDSEGDGIGPTR